MVTSSLVGLLAAEAAKPANPILPDGAELFWGVLSFVILFALMAKFGFPAVNNAMQARTDKIRQSIDDAEKAKHDAEAVLADYTRQLNDSKAEANRIIEEARQQAERLKQDVMASAQAEASELRTKAEADAQGAKARATASLQGEIQAMVLDLAGRVVEKNLDDETNRRLVESFLANVATA